MTAPDLHQLIDRLISAAIKAGQEIERGHGLTSNIPVEEAKRRLYTRLEQHGLDGTGWIPEPEFAGCPRCGTGDCPGGGSRGVCDREHVELRRERGLLEQQHGVLLDERDRALGEADELRAVIVDLHERLETERERADAAEARWREYEVEREAALRYERERTG